MESSTWILLPKYMEDEATVSLKAMWFFVLLFFLFTNSDSLRNTQYKYKEDKTKTTHDQNIPKTKSAEHLP